jgi:hypothetical protein
MDTTEIQGGGKHSAPDHPSGLEDVLCANMPLRPDKASSVSETGNEIATRMSKKPDRGRFVDALLVVSTFDLRDLY